MPVSTSNPSTVTRETTDPARPGLLRTGLIIAAVLAAGDLALSVGQIAGTDPVALVVTVAVVIAAIATLVLVPFTWNGRRGPAVAIAVLRPLSALTALPAFFFPSVPAAFVALAASGILLAAAAAALILFGMRRRS
jgi:hypothetical protein